MTNLFSVNNGCGEGAYTPREPDYTVVGIVGLGTMGASIAACLLAAGHRVVAVEVDEKLRCAARRRVLHYLEEFDERSGLEAGPETYLGRFDISAGYHILRPCRLVIESIIEDVAAKQHAIRGIEQFVSADALIGSNTSALPITQLQSAASHPDRVFGMHWSIRPASPFIEIIRGDDTSQKALDRAGELARFWGKDPAMVQVDVRGFIANRIAYAMYREAMHLIEIGAATAEDIDRAVKYTIADWLPTGSVFGFVQYNLPLTMAIMRDLFPDLCNSGDVPLILEALQRDGGDTLYGYSPEILSRLADGNGACHSEEHSAQLNEHEAADHESSEPEVVDGPEEETPVLRPV